MNAQAEIEAIKQLKFRYFRLLDQKRIDELGELLAPDCTVSYNMGRYGSSDRAATIEFLRDSMTKTTMLTLHHGHHPEIELLSDTEATGTWYLHDIVVNLELKTRLEGGAFYTDRYRKINGEWKFAHTGYRRTFEVTQPLGDVDIFNGFIEDGPFGK
jgi:hypothetical protein